MVSRRTSVYLFVRPSAVIPIIAIFENNIFDMIFVFIKRALCDRHIDHWQKFG